MAPRRLALPSTLGATGFTVDPALPNSLYVCFEREEFKCALALEVVQYSLPSFFSYLQHLESQASHPQDIFVLLARRKETLHPLHTSKLLHF
jgi:hypothetical protein